jgi:hypothetical protein
MMSEVLVFSIFKLSTNLYHRVFRSLKTRLLLREKVRHLSRDAGIERMESALTDTRSNFFESKEKNTGSLIALIPSPSNSDPSSFMQNYIPTLMQV